MKTLGSCALILLVQCPAICEEFAEPPEFPKEVRDIFFEDAREALSGPPPAHDKLVMPTPQGSQPDQSDNWNEVIDADTLTTEVKRIANRLSTIVSKPGQFKAATHEECRRELTMLAALFSVIETYPDDLPWKTAAEVMEQACLRAAASCAEGSDKSLASVYELLSHLEELLSGQAVSASQAVENDLIPELSLLMQRMEITMEGVLPLLTSKQFEFRKRTQDVAHEAELLAMLSQFIRRDEYGYADDDTFQGHADKLREAANKLKGAAANRYFTKSVEAITTISRSCADCHADYRG